MSPSPAILSLNCNFIAEIKEFKTIYCLISGGWHSTAAALLLYHFGFKNVILLNNHTFLESPKNIQTMKKLVEYTGFQYIQTEPKLPKGKTPASILKDSIKKMNEVQDDIKNGCYDRTKFDCCHYLKKANAIKFYRTIDKQTSVIISGITPYESRRRGLWLKERRDKHTWIRNHAKMGHVWYAYPFRDSYKEEDFHQYLKWNGFGETEHSGCICCPIVVLFDIYESKSYDVTRKLMKQLGVCIFKPIQKRLIE